MNSGRRFPPAILFLVLGLASAVALANEAGQAPATQAEAPDEVDLLRRQLAAQKTLNTQLQERVKALEKALARAGSGEAPVVIALDKKAPPPVPPKLKSRGTTAIEQALVSKGLVLLPPGMIRVTPSMNWSHSGGGQDAQDSYLLGLGVEAGLPFGLAASARVPWVWRDFASGNNEGVGDLNLALSKRLNNQGKHLPSFVARFGYKHDNGDASVTRPPIGTGFRSWEASLSAVKQFDPVVLFGGVSWSSSLDEPGIPGGRVEPGDARGFDLGLSLAATPEISVDTGVSLAFIEAPRFRAITGDSFEGDSLTVGNFNLGTGILLSRRLFLSLNLSAGITEDAGDLGFSLALPYQF